MATIKVTGISAEEAPSPIMRQTWRDNWIVGLPGLGNWVASNGNTVFTAAVPGTAAAVTAVVQGDLNAWCPDGNDGHHTWTVS